MKSKLRLVWTHEALVRLSQIQDFISLDSPKRAENFVDYLVERGESVFQNPQIGRIVPEISDPKIREIIAKKYRIVYRIRERDIQILTVFEGHRLLSLDELDID